MSGSPATWTTRLSPRPPPSRSVEPSTQRSSPAASPTVVTDALSDAKPRSGRQCGRLPASVDPLRAAEGQGPAARRSLRRQSRCAAACSARSDLELLTAFADQAAVAIDNARSTTISRQRMRQVASLKEYQDNIFRSVGSAVVSIGPQRPDDHLQPGGRTASSAARPRSGRAGLPPDVLGEPLAARLFRPITRASRGGALGQRPGSALLPAGPRTGLPRPERLGAARPRPVSRSAWCW